jgi:hypothetical protein
MEFDPRQALWCLAHTHVNIVTTEGMLREANRLRTLAVLISVQQEGYHANAL